MTGIIYNNNEYIINTGNSKIEYSAMGGTNSSYSMYGDEIPVIIQDNVQVFGENGYIKVIKNGVTQSNRNYWDTGVRLRCENNDTFSIEATYIPDMVYGNAHNYLFSEQGYYKGWYAGIYRNGKPWIENHYEGAFCLNGTFIVEMNKPITYKIQGTSDDVILTISQGEHTETLHRRYHINFKSYDTYKIGNASLAGGETIFSGEMTKFEIIKNNEMLFTLNDL